MNARPAAVHHQHELAASGPEREEGSGTRGGGGEKERGEAAAQCLLKHSHVNQKPIAQAHTATQDQIAAAHTHTQGRIKRRYDRITG